MFKTGATSAMRGVVIARPVSRRYTPRFARPVGIGGAIIRNTPP
jgi:hypothetical protein